MNSKHEIITEICAGLQKLAGNSVKIEKMDVKKSNNRKMIGVTAHTPESAASPVFYINGFVDKVYSGEMKVQEAANEIFKDMRNELENIPVINEADIAINKDKILNNVVYRVVNTKKSSDFLQQMMHREFLDLSVTYSAIMKKDEDYTYSIPVTDKLGDTFDICLDELENAARENTTKIGFSVVPLASIVGYALDIKDSYVMTIGIPHISGAAVILYPDCFRVLAEQMGSDLYIMPSSIEEVLVVPAVGNDRGELIQRVREVNESTARPELQLSDKLYKYSRKDNSIAFA